MGKSVKKTLLLAKIQPAAGVDSGPTTLANAVLLRNVTATPLEVEFAERALVRPYMGNSGQIATSHHALIEGEVEFAGSGKPGKPPAWGHLLRACGFAETIKADTDVRYTPVSEGFEMLTLHYYLDGLFHRLTDARGTVTFNITSKAIPFMRFRFMGTYQPITDAAHPPTADFSAFLKPLAVNIANTPQWALGGYTGPLQSLTADIANQLIWRSLVMSEGAEITDRKPTGNLSLELPKIAQLDWPTMVLSAKDSPLSITHGKTAGNIIEMLMPTAQLAKPSYSEQDGVAMLGIDVNFNPAAGNDEVQIVVR